MKKMLPAPLQSLIVKTSAFLICIVASAFLFGKAHAQVELFRQEFTGASVTTPTGSFGTISHSDYVAASSPASHQFTSIAGGTQSTSNLQVNVSSSGEFQAISAGTSFLWAATRNVNIATSPQILKIKFRLRTDVTSTGSSSKFWFQVGTNFSNDVSSITKPTDATSVHSGFSLRYVSSSAGPTLYRNDGTTQIGATNIGEAYNDWAIVINNSGSSFTYTDTTGASQTIANDTYDLWIGTTLWGNDIPATTGSLAINQFKFGDYNTNGRASLYFDWIKVEELLANTSYYYKGTGALNEVTNWGQNTDGTGTAPADFTTANQTFEIRNTTSVTNSTLWSVSGTGSKIVLGNSAVAGITLTDDGGISGTFDIAAASSGSNSIALNTTTIPAFAAVHATSSVTYSGGSAQTIAAATYGNLTLNNASGGTLAGAITTAGTLTITAGALSASTFNITANGNWVNNGTYTKGTGNVIFGGSTTISGASSNSFNAVTINASSSLTGPASATINVSGNWVNNGTFTHNSGTLNFNGTTTVSGSGSHAFNNVSVAAASSVSMPAASIRGDLTNANSFTATGAITFNGVANQTVSGAGGTTIFTTITLNNTGGAGSNMVDFQSVITMNVAAGSATLTLTAGIFRLSSASTITPFGGSVTISSAAGLILNHASAVSNWGNAGSLTMNGILTITSNGGTMTVGTGNNNLTVGASPAILTLAGGTLNIRGRLLATSTGTTTISGGSLTIPTGGTVNTGSNSIVQIGSSHVFSLTSGNINVRSANANTTLPDINISQPSNTITGGTINVSDATITLSSNIPFFDFGVSNGSGTGVARLSAALTVLNDITVSSGTLNANNFNITLGGNWSNSGTFTPGTNTVTFNGTSQQQYTRTGTGTFSGLTIDNTAGLLLNNSLTASGTCTLTDGKVTLGANNLECNALSGGSSSNYVVTNGAGALKINGIGAADFLFPVGPTSSSYNPLIINNAGTADNLSVRVLTTITNAPLDPTKVVNREWIVTEDVAGGSDATLTAQWNASEEAASFNNAGTVVVARHNGASYIERSAIVAGSDPYTATATGFTDFSPFVVGNAGAFSSDATILVDQTGFISDFGNVIAGTNSAERQYSISGMNLTDDITVTAPTGFLVSKSSTTGFNSSIVFAHTGGTVSASDVFVRFSPTAATGAIGPVDITHTSNLAITKNLGVSGNAIATEPTTIGTITFGTATATTIPVNLPTIGDGDGRIIVVKEGSAPDAPLGGTEYAANAAFGSGATTGAGSYVVYDGTGSGSDVMTVTALNANTTYYFAVYEYNVGSGTSQNYLTTSFANGSQMTADGTLATDFFRSFTSGDWNVAGTWESSHDGSTNWTGASIFPDFSASGITVLNTHTVTVTANLTVDELTIAAGGQVDVNNGVTLTVDNGTGTDIVVNGYLKNSGTITLSGTGEVSGASATYEHNASNINPPAFAWTAGATLKLTGTITGQGVNPTGRLTSGNYQNIVWGGAINTSGDYVSFGDNTITIAGKLTVAGTGAGALLTSAGGTSPTVAEYEQTSGNVFVNRNSGSTRSLTVTGNATISGGAMHIKTLASGGAGQFSVGGHLTVQTGGTLTNSGTAGSAVIQLDGTGTQTVTGVAGAGVSGNINMVVNKASGIVSLGSDMTVPGTGSLTLTSGKISIGANTLTLGGTISGGSASNNLIGGSTSNLVINGTGSLGTLFFDQTTDGTTNAINNFTLNRTSSGAATLGNKMVLLSTYTPTAGTLAAGGFLHLRSTASNTARIAAGASGGGYITGNVVTERYISGIGIFGNPSAYNRAYRMLTPMVTTTGTINANWQEGQTNPDVNTILNTNPGYGTQITGAGGAANGFDPTLSNSSSLYTFNAVTPSWVAATNTNVATLNAKTGYLLYIRGNRSMDMTSTASPLPATNTTLRATGTLLTGTQTFASLQGSGKYNLVTNPFASPIDWASIYGANSTDFENYYTFWDPNQGSRGAFVTVTSGGIISAGDATTSIQSGQAFFVKALPGAGSPTLTVSETHKTTTNNIDVFRNGSTEQFRTSLYFNDGFVRRLADGVVNVYDNNYSTEVDGRDALQMANWDEDIAIVRNSNSLSIETRPLIDVADTIFLSVARLKQQPYQWQFDPSSFNAPGLQAYLQDKFLNNETPVSLSAQTLVDFTVTTDAASAAADRFRIVFRSSAPLPVKITKVKATDKQTAIQVEWNTVGEFEMDKYLVEKSTDGREFVAVASVLSKNIANATTYSWMDIDRVTGNNYYRIRSVSKNGQATVSEVVRVNVGKGKDGITVYPNPIVGDVVAVQLNNVASGKYSIVITNKLGQQVSVTSFDHAGGSASQTISLPKAVTAGIYQLQVIGTGVKYELQIIKN